MFIVACRVRPGLKHAPQNGGQERGRGLRGKGQGVGFDWNSV